MSPIILSGKCAAKCEGFCIRCTLYLKTRFRRGISEKGCRRLVSCVTGKYFLRRMAQDFGTTCLEYLKERYSMFFGK